MSNPLHHKPATGRASALEHERLLREVTAVFDDYPADCLSPSAVRLVNGIRRRVLDAVGSPLTSSTLRSPERDACPAGLAGDGVTRQLSEIATASPATIPTVQHWSPAPSATATVERTELAVSLTVVGPAAPRPSSNPTEREEARRTTDALRHNSIAAPLPTAIGGGSGATEFRTSVDPMDITPIVTYGGAPDAAAEPDVARCQEAAGDLSRWHFAARPPATASDADNPVRSALREAATTAILRLRAAATPLSSAPPIVLDARTGALPCHDSAASRSATSRLVVSPSSSKTGPVDPRRNSAGGTPRRGRNDAQPWASRHATPQGADPRNSSPFSARSQTA